MARSAWNASAKSSLTASLDRTILKLFKWELIQINELPRRGLWQKNLEKKPQKAKF